MYMKETNQNTAGEMLPGADHEYQFESAEMRDLYEKYKVKPDVLTADDIMRMVPKLASHPRLVNWLVHAFALDKVNALHAHNCHTPGRLSCAVCSTTSTSLWRWRTPLFTRISPQGRSLP